MKILPTYPSHSVQSIADFHKFYVDGATLDAKMLDFEG
jgi:hypothetical protein